jgi:hypothetical protein
VLVSLADGQPPLLLSGIGGALSATTSGGPGQWSIRIEGAQRIRATLPQGVRPLPDRTARTLGALANKVGTEAALWTGEAPELLAFEARLEDGAVVGVWRYDRPGAVLPPAVLLAKEAGCEVETLTAVRPVAAPLPDGPTAFSAEPRIVLRVPFRPFAAGRAVVSGFPGVSAVDDSATNVLLGSLLFGPGSAEARSVVREALVSTLVRGRQPLTGEMVGYGPDGSGSYTIALLALLRRLQAPQEDDGNPSRNELLWSFDPRAMVLWLPGDEAAAAQALLCLALSLEPAPVRRWQGAIAGLGLVAEAELPKFRAKHGLPAEGGRRCQLRPVVRRLAGLPEGDAWIRACDSPLRMLVAPESAALTAGPGLRWQSLAEPTVFELSAPEPIRASAADAGTTVSGTGTRQYFRLEATRTTPGVAEVSLQMERFGRWVPTWPGWPDWTQGLR